MTKYILVGGYPHKTSDEGKAFAEELVDGFSEPVKILECLFARPKENWDLAFAQDQEFFKKHLPRKKLDIVRAEPDRFLEQVKWADVIYIRGGDLEISLVEFLRQSGFDKELAGKTLAGSSAGADAIAKYYYGLDDFKIWEGSGLLPIKVLVHYRSDYNSPNIDWDKAEAELEGYKEKLPLVTIREGEFKVIRQNS